MSSLNFANGLREHMLTLCCLALVGSASIGAASRANAQTASALGTAAFSTSAPGWSCDAGTFIASGGNATPHIGPPCTLSAQVVWGVLPAMRAGSMTVDYTFTAVPNPDGTIPFFRYNINFSAFAETQSDYQQAYARVHHREIFGGDVDAYADVPYFTYTDGLPGGEKERLPGESRVT